MANEAFDELGTREEATSCGWGKSNKDTLFGVVSRAENLLLH
jgi:hypothetical protein